MEHCYCRAIADGYRADSWSVRSTRVDDAAPTSAQEQKGENETARDYSFLNHKRVSFKLTDSNNHYSKNEISVNFVRVFLIGNLAARFQKSNILGDPGYCWMCACRCVGFAHNEL